MENKGYCTFILKKNTKQQYPVTSTLRPNHNFYAPENSNMCFGEVTVLNDEWIYPCDSKVVLSGEFKLRANTLQMEKFLKLLANKKLIMELFIVIQNDAIPVLISNGLKR